MYATISTLSPLSAIVTSRIAILMRPSAHIWNLKVWDSKLKIPSLRTSSQRKRQRRRISMGVECTYLPQEKIIHFLAWRTCLILKIKNQQVYCLTRKLNWQQIRQLSSSIQYKRSASRLLQITVNLNMREFTMCRLLTCPIRLRLPKQLPRLHFRITSKFSKGIISKFSKEMKPRGEIVLATSRKLLRSLWVKKLSHPPSSAKDKSSQQLWSVISWRLHQLPSSVLIRVAKVHKPQIKKWEGSNCHKLRTNCSQSKSRSTHRRRCSLQ